MADTSALRARVEDYARRVQRGAADRTTDRLVKATPRVTGEMIRAGNRQRRDSQSGGTFTTLLRQEAGGGRPEQLPNWLDEGRQFIIRPRYARVLVFRVSSRVVFARSVLWNRSRRSQGFWSNAVNAQSWRQDLEAEAGRQTP